MRSYRHVVCVAFTSTLLALLSGCLGRLNMDYGKFDPRCREWQKHATDIQYGTHVAATSSGIDEYYEYFVCINMIHLPIMYSERMRYILDNAQDFMRIAPDRLRASRNWKETWLLSMILHKMQMERRYDVARDEDVMRAWREALDKQKYSQDHFVVKWYTEVARQRDVQ